MLRAAGNHGKKCVVNYAWVEESLLSILGAGILSRGGYLFQPQTILQLLRRGKRVSRLSVLIGTDSNFYFASHFQTPNCTNHSIRISRSSTLKTTGWTNCSWIEAVSINHKQQTTGGDAYAQDWPEETTCTICHPSIEFAPKGRKKKN